MSVAGQGAPVAVARTYFGIQALSGAAWWIAVLSSPDVRRWTLGHWEPAILFGPDAVLFVGASAAAALRGSRAAAVTAAVWTTATTLALGAHGMIERIAGWGVVLMVAATVCTVAAAATIWYGHLPIGWFFTGPFALRAAEEASNGRHLRRSLAQLVVFWTTFFLLVPLVLVAAEDRLRLGLPVLDPDWVRLVGISVLAVGSAIGLWSCVTMALHGDGTPLPSEAARKLVLTGPYRWVRNPMALSGALQTVGVGLWFGSWMVVVVAGAGAVVWNAVIRPTEEADLAARFGEQYERYARDVRCWVPSRP